MEDFKVGDKVVVVRSNKKEILGLMANVINVNSTKSSIGL